MIPESLCITGGRPLHGTVATSGSKNAALPIMAASILARQPVVLEGVPRLTDVDTLAEILRSLGLSVSWSQEGTLELATVELDPVRADYELVSRMRAGFCVLGPLLARRGRAAVSLPGGCAIGDRPVDLHLAALTALGADLKVEHGYVVGRTEQLVGAEVQLSGPRGPTVTGTANVLCAAAMARGRSVLYGAAVEPEVVDLGRFLNAMGARIEGLGTSTIEVEGVEKLGGADYRIIPDRIEAATLLLAIAVTGGRATIEDLVPGHLDAVLNALQRSGCRIKTTENSVCLTAPQRPRAQNISAQPYPGIPTDIQAQWMAFLALADGRSTISDEVFPGRFMHVAE
ncbi:MAG: UDP-N-acetylglucosamine 1-carboxyvinyltransferase, partial [Pirellulales bacterium]|nr:UDP-N-acetylglucosamine 1-carboxyvinyltransferase [Pirellulales bacterium]